MTNKTFWVAWRSSNSVTESEAEGVPLGMIKIESRGGLLLPSPELNDFVRHLECACSALLSEDAVLLRGQRHVREVQESIIASAHIRASFVATTKHARSLAAISGRRTEDDTTDLLRYAVEAWFRMRGPDFVVKTRKRHNIGISQQSKSVSLRAPLAVAASAAPIAKPKRALSPPALAAEEAAPSSYLSTLTFLTTSSGRKTWRFSWKALRATAACLLNAQKSLSTPPSWIQTGNSLRTKKNSLLRVDLPWLWTALEHHTRKERRRRRRRRSKRETE